jgi:4-hydroxy-tetrahydrodipicolinate synthase
MKKKLVFKGAGCALVTPMKRGKIDYNSLDGIIEEQIKGGTEALIVGGTTGEAATLSDTERYELFAHVKEKLSGRAKLIFGTGTNDTRLAVKHTLMAERIGCDAILTVTPYYNKGTFRGVTEHYKRIADATSLPIILYNVPGRTGVNLTVRQLEELAQIENIVGIKEAGDSADRLTELSRFGDELWLYAGCDSQIFEVLSLGGAGVISVVSNIYPRAVAELCESYFSGDVKDSHLLQLRLLEFIKLMFSETNPSPIKYAMSLLGLCSSEVRLPLYRPEKSTRAAIKAEMDRLHSAYPNDFHALF